MSIFIKYIILVVVVSIVVSLLSYVLGNRQGTSEKKTAYECGYEAFEDSRERFEVKFYLIGLFFIVFDLEVAYIFPYLCVSERVGDMGMFYMVDFLVELCIAYIYIWRVGGLKLED